MNKAFRIGMISALLIWSDLGAGCQAPRDRVDVIGNARFKHQVGAALSLMRDKAPEAYGTVARYAPRIEQAERSGMEAYRDPPTFTMADTTAFYSVTWCAGCIAHDAYHSRMYHEYQDNHPGPVPGEAWTGDRAERLCLDYQLEVMRSIVAPQSEIAYLESVEVHYYDTNKDGTYDRDDYEGRHW
jgi:hypothetical protein